MVIHVVPFLSPCEQTVPSDKLRLQRDIGYHILWGARVWIFISLSIFYRFFVETHWRFTNTNRTFQWFLTNYSASYISNFFSFVLKENRLTVIEISQWCLKYDHYFEVSMRLYFCVWTEVLVSGTRVAA